MEILSPTDDVSDLAPPVVPVPVVQACTVRQLPCSNIINNLWTGWWLNTTETAPAKDTDDANEVYLKTTADGRDLSLPSPLAPEECVYLLPRKHVLL